MNASFAHLAGAPSPATPPPLTLTEWEAEFPLLVAMPVTHSTNAPSLTTTSPSPATTITPGRVLTALRHILRRGSSSRSMQPSTPATTSSTPAVVSVEPVELDDTYSDTDIQTFEEYSEIIKEEKIAMHKVNKEKVLEELLAKGRQSVVHERCKGSDSDSSRSRLHIMLLLFRFRRNKAHAAGAKKRGSLEGCFSEAIRCWLSEKKYGVAMKNQTFRFLDEFRKNYEQNYQFVKDKCNELYKSYNNEEEMDITEFNAEIKKIKASGTKGVNIRSKHVTFVRKNVYGGEGTNNTSDTSRGDTMRKNLDSGAGMVEILRFVDTDNNELSNTEKMKRLGEIIACMEKLRKKVANKQAVSMDDVDRHLWEYFSIGDTKKSYSFADADRRSIMAMAHSKLKGVWGDIRTKGLICNTYEELLGKGGKVDRYLQKRDKDDHHSAGIRMFTIACSKERVENVARYCYDGHGACIPIKMCGAVGYLVFSVGGTSEEDVLVTAGPDNEVKLMHWKFTICPGQSVNRHGGRENNKHSVQLSPHLFWSISTGIFFETAKDTNTGAASRIKNKKHRESGLWGTLPITIDGAYRGIRMLYLSSDGTTLLTRFNLQLPLAFRINKISTNKKLSHHRWVAISMHALGLDRPSKDGMKFRYPKRSWEEMYLSTGGTQVDNDDIQQQRELLEHYGLEDVDMPELQPEEADVNIPQGQCDVDHCLHRYHWITNSMYLAFAMSHSSNTKNSYKRRGRRDWCFLLSEEHYTNGD